MDISISDNINIIYISENKKRRKVYYSFFDYFFVYTTSSNGGCFTKDKNPK